MTCFRKKHNICGIEGELELSFREGEDTFDLQKWTTSKLSKDGVHKVTIHYDNSLRNGHNEFSMVADTPDIIGPFDAEWCKGFKKLSHLATWHLMSSKGPIHYPSNAVYLAGDRDYRGLRKGESKPLVDRDGNHIYRARLKVPPSLDLPPGVEPPPATAVYELWMLEGEGKARQLDAARSSAIWPDATDEDLMQEPDQLRAALGARLPGLIESFKADITKAGLYWTPGDVPF